MLWLPELAIDRAWMPSCCWTWRACRRVEFGIHVRVDELADTAIERVGQGLDEVLLQADAVLDRTEVGGGIGDRAEGFVDAADVGLELGEVGSVVGELGDVDSGRC